MNNGSIQAARETLAKSEGALMNADRKFFISVAERYEAIKAKGTSAHPADMRRLRNEVADWMRNHNEKPDWNSAKDMPVFEGANAWADLLNIEIANHATIKAAYGERPDAAGWYDAETGKAIQVYAPDQAVFDGERQRGTPGVGSLVAALLNGPKTDEIKAALSEGTDSAGGYSIPQHVLREFIDKLRAKTQFVQAGARTVILDGMKTRIMRVASDPVAAWRAENAAVAESAPTFDAVDFQPKSLAVLVKVPVELLQDSVNVDAALTKALVDALSIELDRACMFGTGADNQPMGLYNVTGINEVSMGVNGATPSDYDPFIDALYEMEVDNAGVASAVILHPRTGKTLRKLKDSTAQPLRLPPALENLSFLPSTSVPIDLDQGTAVDVCSTALVGDYTQALLGLRQELRIQRLDQTFAGNLQVGFLAHMRADVAFAHPQSFCRIVGIKA